jgi:flagellar hook assembly protein FlgD
VVDQSFGIGSRTLTWDGRDESGRRAPSGVYLYRLVGPGLRAVRKVTLMH